MLCAGPSCGGPALAESRTSHAVFPVHCASSHASCRPPPPPRLMSAKATAMWQHTAGGCGQRPRFRARALAAQPASQPLHSAHPVRSWGTACLSGWRLVLPRRQAAAREVSGGPPGGPCCCNGEPAKGERVGEVGLSAYFLWWALMNRHVAHSTVTRGIGTTTQRCVPCQGRDCVRWCGNRRRLGVTDGGGRRLLGGDRRRLGGTRQRYGGDRRRLGGDRRRLGGNRQRYGGDRRRLGGNRRRLGGDRRRFGGDCEHSSLSV